MNLRRFSMNGLALTHRAIMGAGCDATRACAVAPLRYAHSIFSPQPGGGWEVKSQRNYSLREVLRLKRQFARLVFDRSLGVGLARQVTIPHNPTEGLMTNLLHVIEVVHRVRPDAAVYVDWILRGNEQGFKYGRIGDDVWGNLFRSLGTAPSDASLRAADSIDLAFWGTGKDYLKGRKLLKHRLNYHRTISSWIEVTNARVLKRVRDIRHNSFEGRFCLGVHRRTPNALVSNLQSDGRAPSLDMLIERCRSLLRAAQREGVVFLATDDAEAVDAFAKAFGPRLIFQEHVQRTAPNKSEVHFRDWQELSLSDAEDVLVDTLLLSHCEVLLHGSSAVSTVASLLNPRLQLQRVFGGTAEPFRRT